MKRNRNFVRRRFNEDYNYDIHVYASEILQIFKDFNIKVDDYNYRKSDYGDGWHLRTGQPVFRVETPTLSRGQLMKLEQAFDDMHRNYGNFHFHYFQGGGMLRDFYTIFDFFVD